MDYEGIDNVICDAEEADWLDISYAEKNYVQTQPKQRKKFPLKNIKFPKGKKAFVLIGVACVCVALLVVALCVDNSFSKDVFTTAKTAYTGVLSAFGGKTDNANSVIDIPCNATLIDYQDGVGTFGGGKVVLSFTNGQVSSVTQNSVTVTVDESTSIVYSNLTNVLVQVGDTVSENSLLGKYTDTFCATVQNNGQTVQDVVASPTQLVWKV